MTYPTPKESSNLWRVYESVQSTWPKPRVWGATLRRPARLYTPTQLVPRTI